MKLSAPVGNGVGVQKFQINPAPGGGVLLSGTAQTPLGAATAAAPEATPETPAVPPTPTPPATPFSRLYPGVDPSKVEMTIDDKTKKIRFKPIETPPETPAETPATPSAPAPVAPSEPDTVAQLRAQIEQQNQLMTAMLQAQLTGRPLAEVLSGQPAAPPEPDYSKFDLEDEDSRAEFVKQLRADAKAAAKAEMQAEINALRPSIEDTRRHSERFAIQAEHGSDPDYQQKVALTEKLMGNNPNVSFKATYNLISQIQSSLSPASGASLGRPSGPVLTPAQAEAKAAQAARYQSTNGGRASGPPEPPPDVAKNFKKLAAWVAHQQALGNLP